jgi:carbon-monoxide dehydrogenase small subunit
MSTDVEIGFKLNGVATLTKVPADMSALDMLRELLGLTGTKYGCGEGECGACTILVDGLSINSCLTFAADCDGREIVTIEGVEAEKLKKSFVDHGAVQCGFCTPGFVMQAHHLLERQRRPDERQVRRGIEGNLCRCTGYKKIIEAILEAAA